MNLLFYAPQMAEYGGIERHTCALAAACALRGHRVRFITTSNSLGADLRRQMAHPQVEFRELPATRGSASKLRKLLWLLLEVRRARLTAPWDLIYTNGQSALARFVWRAAPLPSTRILHHHHTAADAAERAGWSRGFQRVVETAPELVGCSRATCDALSAAAGGRMSHFLPYLTRCPVAAPSVVDRPLGPRLRFGFLGRLIPEKGIDDVIALASRPDLPDIEWHVHGAGPAYPAETFAGRERLIYHGAFRSLEEHARILQGLDAVVLFSRHNEGMPLSLIEAMSAGLPWIANDRGGVREIAAAARHAWLLPLDADDEKRAATVRAAAAEIRAGACSRVSQRQAYERHYAPDHVTGLWLRYLESGLA